MLKRDQLKSELLYLALTPLQSTSTQVVTLPSGIKLMTGNTFSEMFRPILLKQVQLLDYYPEEIRNVSINAFEKSASVWISLDGKFETLLRKPYEYSSSEPLIGFGEEFIPSYFSSLGNLLTRKLFSVINGTTFLGYSNIFLCDDLEFLVIFTEPMTKTRKVGEVGDEYELEHFLNEKVGTTWSSRNGQAYSEVKWKSWDISVLLGESDNLSYPFDFPENLLTPKAFDEDFSELLEDLLNIAYSCNFLPTQLEYLLTATGINFELTLESEDGKKIKIQVSNYDRLQDTH